MAKWIKKIGIIALTIILSSSMVVYGKNHWQNHTIVGYGTINGNLFMPTVVQADKEHYYILDAEGVKLFSKNDQSFFASYPVKLSLTQSFNDIYSMQFLESLLIAGNFRQWIQKLMDKPLDIFLPKVDLKVDQQGQYYINDFFGIRAFDKQTGESKGVLYYPIDHLPEQPKNVFYDLRDQIFYLLFSFSEEIHYCTMNLSGELIQTKILEFSADNSSIIDFAVASDGTMALLLRDYSQSMIVLLNANGEKIGEGVLGNRNFSPMSFCFIGNRELAIVGMNIQNLFGKSVNNVITHVIFSNESRELELVDEYSFYDDSFGFALFDISHNEDSYLIASMGFFSDIADAKVISLPLDENSNCDPIQIGSSPYSNGQTFLSLASTIDENGNLYQHSLFSHQIQVFQNDGTMMPNIPINLNELTTVMGISFPPMITSMAISGDYLYAAQFFPPTVSMYSLKSNRWTNLYAGDVTGMMQPLYLDMKIIDEKICLLDPIKRIVHVIDEEGHSIFRSIQLPSNYSEEKPAFFCSFARNENKLCFLDGLNQKIAIYDLLTFEWLETIEIPMKKSFFFSIENHPDTGWLVGDLNKHQIHHFNFKGELLQSFGQKTIIKERGTIADYHKFQDGFHVPLKIMLNEKTLVVNDFFNSRFHFFDFP